MWLTVAFWVSVVLATAYLAYPAWCRLTATKAEARGSLAGDDLVPVPTTAYTLAISIAAPPADVYRWLARPGRSAADGDRQNGRRSDRHALLEKVLRRQLGARATAEPTQHALVPGDRIWLVSPFDGADSQQHALVVSAVVGQNLVLVQSMPRAGRAASWAFVLRARNDGDGTRLVLRHRSFGARRREAALVPVMYARARGLLKTLKRRAEHAQPMRVPRSVAA